MPLLEQLSALPDYYDTLRLKVKKKKTHTLKTTASASQMESNHRHS